MKRKNDPPVNRLGVQERQRIWKPTTALEKAERDLYLDNMILGRKHRNVRKRKSDIKQNRYNILKRIEKDEEEKQLINCYNYMIQGDWLNFDAVVRTDVSWNALIYAIPQELFKFLINSTHNVLPTPDNLRRWGKSSVDIACTLCQYSNRSLKHILNGCPAALQQGRYTWRHDNILECIVKQLNAVLPEIKGKKVSKPPNFIKFVREGEKPDKRKTEFRSGLLLSAQDWIAMHDSTSSPLIIPQHITQTSLRPDIIMYSNETRQIVLLELTIPAEDNIVQRHSDKEFKYAKLVDDIELNHWEGYVFAVEISSRGYVAKSYGYAMKRLGAIQRQVSKFTQELSQICISSSYTIFQEYVETCLFT